MIPHVGDAESHAHVLAGQHLLGDRDIEQAQIRQINVKDHGGRFVIRVRRGFFDDAIYGDSHDRIAFLDVLGDGDGRRGSIRARISGLSGDADAKASPTGRERDVRQWNGLRLDTK
jgi:hypothetical protein